MNIKKNSTDNEISVIKKHSTKSFIIAFILGIFIGLAVIVPGISGSTIAIIFGLYTGMLYAIGNILADFKRCFAFLLPIGLGVVIGFAAGFLVIQSVFEMYLFQLICLFVGLMLGAVPAITKEIKGAKITPLRVILLIIGFMIPLAIGVVSIVLSSAESESAASFTGFPWWLFAAYLPLGFVVSITQIVPGLSATAILMAFGQFKPILNSLHSEYIFGNPIVVLLYACLGIGFIVGLISMSKLFSSILSKHKHTAFFAVTGLSFGSIASMFVNTDMYELYLEWGASNSLPVTVIIIGAILLIAGFAVSLLLTKYELSHSKE